MVKKEGQKTCLHCSNKIDLKNHNFVLIGTYNRTSKPDDEKYFHFQCWVDYFKQCVLKKAENNVAMMRNKAMELFNNPVMKGMLSQISGSDQILSMLQMPMQEKKDDGDGNILKAIITEKIQNDRTKKRSAKKRKSNR